MLKLILLYVILTFPISLQSQSKPQCSCPTIPADGQGNTSCSVNESGGRCTIDYNLFGPENERRAAELLFKFSGRAIKAPDPNLSADEALQALSSKTGDELQDAILVYLAVAAGDQDSRYRGTVPLDQLKEVVEIVKSTDVARLITENFSANQRLKWAEQSNDVLAKIELPAPVTKNGATVSPGCIEFMTSNRSNRAWMMFKAKWSPTRIKPTCGGPAFHARNAGFGKKKCSLVGEAATE